MVVNSAGGVLQEITFFGSPRELKEGTILLWITLPQ
jgi:hypothetical protein